MSTAPACVLLPDDIHGARGAVMSTAEQCRAMGLKVGDTIEGREESGHTYWHEARLTLLWLGEQVAVFSETSRSNVRPQWSEPEECANWTLDCREWHRAALSQGGGA